MVGRTQLAALDHNMNVGRKQATTKSRKLRYRTEYTKQKGSWVEKNYEKKKKYSFREDLVQAALNAAGSDADLPNVHCVELPPNLTGEAAPSKEDIVQRMQSRMK